tara:strand:+ start:1564 stop:2076 length:513 start_codon:yes stop_codon:yes gene_type:complete
LKYEVVDNFMPEDFHSSLWEIVSNGRFPWFYGAKTNYDPECPYIEQEECLDDYHFIHHFYDDDRPVSPFHEQLILPLLREMGAISSIRIKANWHPRTETVYENPLHKDYPFEHKGAVYYINSNDGYTLFEDGTKIESVANRMLFFESFNLHRSTTCTNARGRFNINFNYF